MSEPVSCVFELYERALGLPAPDREAWVRSCGAEPAVRDRVLGMLRAEATVAGLNAAGGGVEIAAAIGGDTGEDPLPTVRGHYRMIRLIGEGGTGAVYEAEQVSPRRRVAIKALRPGLASRRAVARLRAEADILARLHHPGIAQVFEAGLGDEGQTEQAFIVMELVDGLPIDRHAESWGLSRRERVRLVLGVCDAVEHAHRRGVIHRDLKPANILVTPDGRAKVLDFGVARLVGGEAAGGEAGIVGTPGYMSPEQAEGRSSEVDARADVYALGAVLYRVLTGRTPVSVEGLDLPGALDAVRSCDPEPAGRVDRGLRGDLEAVLSRALARRVEDRYASVAELGSDLRSHLSGRAVAARGDNGLYVAGRHLRRHWVAASLAGAGLVGVLAFAGLAAGEARRGGLLAVRERAAREEADRAALSLRGALYRSHIGEARASLLLGDAAAAGRALGACDPEERGWEWGYLAARLDGSRARFAPFGEGWLNICVSGGVVAAAHHTEGMVLLDAATGRELARDGSLVGVSAFARLDDGALVAALGEGFAVLETPSLRARSRHAVTGGLVRAAGVDARGRVFLLDQQAGVFVVDPVTGAVLGRVGLDSAYAYAMALLDGGERVAVAGDFGLMVARVSTGEVLARAGGFGRVLAVDADGSGERLVVGVEDGTMRVFDAGTGRELLARRTNDNKVNAVAFTPDGGSVVGGSTDTTLSVMDAESGEVTARLTGHSGSVLRLAFDPSGGLWSAARDGTVRSWSPGSLRGGDVARPLPGRSAHRVAPTDSGWLVTARSGEVAWVDPGGGVDGGLTRAGVGAGLGVAWDAASERALVAGEEGVVGLDRAGQALWHRSGGRAAAFDGALAVEVGADGVLRWVDPATGTAVRELPLGDGTAARSIAAGGGRVAVGFASGRVVVVGPDGAVRSVSLHGGKDSWCVGFSPDGRRLLSAGEDGALLLLDAKTLEVVGRGRGHSGAVLAAAYSPDGTRIATGGFDNTVRLWDAASVEELMRLPGHAGAVTGLAFSADGRRLATVASDGSMRMHISEPGIVVPPAGGSGG